MFFIQLTSLLIFLFPDRCFLLEQRNFTTVESLTKAFELLHKIQEVLVWIDILALTGKGVLPGFVFLDKKDV